MGGIANVVIRGIIWLVAVLILAYGVDERKKRREIKKDTGVFFLFLFAIGIISILVWGFAPY